MRPRAGRIAARIPAFLSLIILFLLAGCNLPWLNPEPPAAPEILALRGLVEASAGEPSFTFQNGFPLSARVDVPVQGATPVERARNFIQTYRDLYGQADADLGLELQRASGENGEHVAFYQTYRGIPVFGAQLIVELNAERVVFASGNLLHGDVDIDTDPILNALDAEAAARSALNRPDAALQGQTQLMIFDRSLLADVPPNPRLVWRVGLDAGPTVAFVDAHTGQLVSSFVTAETGLSLDLETANGTSAKDTGCYNWTLENDKIGDEEDVYEEYGSDPEAVSIWLWAHHAYNFYNAWGRDSYDNDGATLEIYIHVDLPNNAQWLWGCGFFEFGEGMVAQDVMVHEFTHAVISHTSDLIYLYQSGALNESFADIMAASEDGNWTIGENMTGGGGPLRDMSTPADMSQYNDATVCEYYYCTSTDNGGVHYNSAVHNYTAYLLAAGGTHNGVTVQGIGMQKMTVLMLNVMYNLPWDAQFVHARDWAVTWALRWAAGGEGGWTAFDVCQVRNAYAATGIAPAGGDFDCDGIENGAEIDADNDGLPNQIDNCPTIPSLNTYDGDKDGLGAPCDPDKDNDGVPNANDNCADYNANPDQADADGNGIGDACQNSDDDDLIDILDNCPLDTNFDQLDSDADGQGDACDTDDDNDGFLDDADNAPQVYNPGQEDGDTDNVGDVIDNCLSIENPDQADTDQDTLGDACDPDQDNDGLTNGNDNCPLNYNPDQLDLNGDGVGVACDPADQQTLSSLFDDIEMMVITDPEEVFKTNITDCSAGCPDEWSYDEFLLDVAVQSLGDEDLAFISDETGAVITKPEGRGDFQQMDFHPLGGHAYFLNVAFDPGRPIGGPATFNVSVKTSLASAPPAPPPPPETSPTPVATSTPTATPTPPITATPARPIFQVPFASRNNIDNIPDCGGPSSVKISVLITNVTSATLYYSVDGNGPFSVPMTHAGGAQWDAVISSGPVLAPYSGELEYYIQAFNGSNYDETPSYGGIHVSSCKP